MHADKKIAVTWLEVVIVAMLLIGGMGAWKLAEHWVNLDLAPEEPTSEQVELKYTIPELKVDLAAAEARLKALQEQDVQEQVAIIKLDAQVSSWEEQYPALASLPILDAVTVPGEVLKAYVQDSRDAMATQLLIVSLESSLANLITETSSLSTTLSAEINPDLRFGTQTRLDLLRSLIATTSTELVEANVRSAEQKAVVAATEEAYPELQDLFQSLAPSLSSQTALAEAYIAAINELAARERTLGTLVTDLGVARDDVLQKTSQLSSAKRNAAVELEAAKEAFRWGKQLRIFLWTALGIVVLFVLAFLVVRSLRARMQIRFPLWLILGTSAVALFILFAFQVADVGGAAIFGALAIISILWIVLTKLPPSSEKV